MLLGRGIGVLLMNLLIRMIGPSIKINSSDAYWVLFKYSSMA